MHLLPQKLALNRNSDLLTKRSSGFTLIEICLVLLLLVLFLGLAIPSLRSVLVEQQVRKEAAQLEVLIRDSMQRSGVTKQRFLVTMTGRSVTVVPLEEGKSALSTLQSAGTTIQWDPGTELQCLVPVSRDSEPKWMIEPHALCPLPRFRIGQGAAWLEFDFNPLSGSLENEVSNFP